MVYFVAFVESQKWQARALECRRMADRFRDEFARNRMLIAAGNFEGVAGELRKLEIARGVLPWEDFYAV